MRVIKNVVNHQPSQQSRPKNSAFVKLIDHRLVAIQFGARDIDFFVENLLGCLAQMAFAPL